VTYDPTNAGLPRDKGINPDGAIISLKIGAVKIYKGCLVEIDATGWATTVMAASVPFAGVAAETVDNSAGAAGAKDIRVYTEGVHNFNIVSGDSITQAHVGKEVYWNDNSTGGVPTSVTLSSSTSAVGPKVGRITKVISATEVEVRINGYAFNQDGQAS
jgi:hypothetical protein